MPKSAFWKRDLLSFLRTGTTRNLNLCLTVEDLEALFGGIAYQVDQNLYGFVDETVEVVFWGGQVESIRFKWMQEPESKWASWFPPARHLTMVRVLKWLIRAKVPFAVWYWDVYGVGVHLTGHGGLLQFDDQGRLLMIAYYRNASKGMAKPKRMLHFVPSERISKTQSQLTKCMPSCCGGLLSQSCSGS